jgi:hypothetical protein
LFQVIPGAGEHRFGLTDIDGGGFDATVDEGGRVSFDGGHDLRT